MSNNTVCFYNDGELDKRSFTMLGLSAKTDDNAIGFFGTGFKYAIATLLRNGCEVTIRMRDPLYDAQDGDDAYTVCKFFTKRDKFRNKEFDFIYCRTDEGTIVRELPFTTHLGTNWKLWQAYRELYTNALDEGGGVCEGTDSTHSVCVFVTSDEFHDVYTQREKYFINPKHKTLARSARMRCIEKIPEGDNVVYYKSMYTGTNLEKPSLFTYDYTITVDLTEDRTLADVWYIKQHICDVWVLGMDYETLVEWLPKASQRDVYEHDLASYNSPSEQFISAVEYLIQKRRPIPMWAHELYLNTRPFDEKITHHKPTKFQQHMLDKAIKVLEHHDCMIDAAKVVICVSLPDDLVGMYKNGTIYLSKSLFERGNMTLLGTLFEEWVQMYHGCEDSTRRMQNILVDKVALLMEQLYDMEVSE